jgi:hypothetical protein
MTDATRSPADFAAMVDDDELMFDEPANIVPTSITEPAEDTAKPRRSPRRGRDAVGTTTEPAPEVAAAQLLPSAAAEPVDAEKPAGSSAPVPQPDVRPAGFDRKQAMLLAIVALALFTSLLSLGGLIAVGRTLAHAEADRARAEDERTALVRVPVMVKALDDASVRIAQAAARTPTSSLSVTGDEMRHAIDDLRLSLANRQPESMAPLVGTLHDGFSEIGTRVDHLADEVDRLNIKLGARPVSVSLSGSRTTRP